MDPSDDGKVINGSTIVWLYPPEAAAPKSEPAPWQNQGNAAAPKVAGNPASSESPAGAGGTPSAGPAYEPPPKAAPVPPTPAEKQAEKVATANAAAASLKAAAENGVPFCEECEAARKKEQEEQQAAGKS